MTQNYTIDTLDFLDLKISKPCLVFLYGDLGAGKTTLSRMIISKYVGKQLEVTSPTYVYYNKYEEAYHFDLYRMQEYDEFVSIGWEEILDNNEGLVLIEWPEILEKYYKPDVKIYLKKTDIEGERRIEVKYKKKI